MEDVLKVCKKHGETAHRLCGLGRHRRLRCLKCRSDAVKKRRAKLKELAVDHMGGSCQVCGYNKCITALEFHHLDPEHKEFGIAANGNTNSLEKIKKELEKCILLCANCHRELHEELRID